MPLAPTDQMRRIDPATGATLSVATVTLPGFAVQGGYGLATDPGSGRLFAVLLVAGPQTWHPVTLDPMTAVATRVGGLNDGVIDITFTPGPDVTPGPPAPVPALPAPFLAGPGSVLAAGGAAVIRWRARRGVAH